MFMKVLAMFIMLTALYVMYRIAFPKRPETKTDNETTQKSAVDISDVVTKSRFVRPDFGQPQTTTATPSQTDTGQEKPLIFASGSEKKDVAIPPDELDEAFGEEPNPEDLDIPPDEDDETEETDIDAEEEAEELRQLLGRDAEPSSGFSVEEMVTAVEAVQNPTDEKAAILRKFEKTDMFEQHVSGNKVKAELIKAIIDRQEQKRTPKVTVESDNSDLKDFDIMEHV
jgi:hypothetical protein